MHPPASAKPLTNAIVGTGNAINLPNNLIKYRINLNLFSSELPAKNYKSNPPENILSFILVVISETGP